MKGTQGAPAKRSTICLNMIVKDEAHVIRRCLDSVRPLIDHWVIVDTGSGDGTQALIRELLADLPGELFERPWRDFAANRSEAIALAQGRADYLLFIDADDSIALPPGFRLPALTADAYQVAIDQGGVRYRRLSLVRSALPWKYSGVLHEVIECAQPYTQLPLEGPRVLMHGDGARSRLPPEEKYVRDAAVLERALEREPGNARYVFYLAQSWRDAGQIEKALETYLRRAEMEGFAEERYCALLEAGRLLRRMERPMEEVIGAFLLAYESRPGRAEALGELARYCRGQGPWWSMASLFAARAAELRQPADLLFVEPAWYDWIALDEYAVAACGLGDYEKSRRLCERLLRGVRTPPAEKPRILQNLNLARKGLGLAPLKHWA